MNSQNDENKLEELKENEETTIVDNEEKNEESVSEEEQSLELNEENKEEEKEEELPEMTPIVEVETTYDYKVLKYCNMYVIKVKRKSLVINLVMAIILVLIGGLFIYSGIKNQNNTYIYSIFTFLIAGWVVFGIFTEEKRIDKSLVNYFKTHAPVKQTFSFDEERIRITATINGEVKQADYPWAYVTEIHAIPEYFFLFLNGGAPIVIDRNPDSIKSGTMEDLEELIRNESSLKPFKQYTKPLVKRLIDVTYYEPVVEKEEETRKEETSEEEKTEEDNKNE